MSIVSDMKSYKYLHLKSTSQSSSGASIEDWEEVATIDVSIYKTNQLSVTNTVKYAEYDYAAFTFYTGFDEREGYDRLVINDEIYDIKKHVKQGMMTFFLLKKVIVHG